MIRFDAVLCDFDGVLRHHGQGGHEALEREYGLPEGTVLKLALAPEYVVPATLGRISQEEWMASVAVPLAAMVGEERGRLLVEAFQSAPQRVDEEVMAILGRLQEKVPVVLVTNATTALEDDLDRLGLTHFADDVVSSARVGAAKPDPRIYEIAAERAGAVPGRCVFIDDRLENVEAARALGMTGVHYSAPADLAHLLA
ncbi:HAD-IA family hydrolase [Nonomuraea sp. NPDC046570]|uniref:HAD-IA family hydrolase n=1 Tax=Nonomuraea sp. NPDC046570 TaxID=3155255 RepID=UPI0033D0008F